METTSTHSPSEYASKKTENDILISNYNLSKMDVENIYSIINDCGYSKFYPNYHLEKGMDNDEIEGSIGFNIMNGEQLVGFIDIKDNKACLIQYSDKILYENDAIQHTLSEYLITFDEKGELISRAEKDITSILKSPSTAKFPWDYDEWAVGKKDGSTIVQGYVDSQNSFGAMIRSVFQITYKDNVITSLIVDGTEYVK